MDLLKEGIPDLYNHFFKEQLQEEMWVYKWFMSIFLYSFPLGLCIRFWDNILAFGTRFIFNISLALLSLMKEQLLELDFCEINEFFKSLKDDTHLDT